MANIKVVKKTNSENYKLNEYLEEAQGKIQEAQACITYTSYPDINADLIKKLQAIEDAIIDLEIAVENQDIMKPVKM